MGPAARDAEPAALSRGAAWIDGKIVPIAEARIPILDWGFTRGDSTYDVVHVWNGRFFRLEDHMARFRRGVERMRYTLPVALDAVPGLLMELVSATRLKNAYVAMIATRGLPEPGSRDPRRCRNQFYAFAIPFVWIADPEKQKSGLHMAIASIPRIAPSSVDPTVKNYHWLDFQMALFAAYDAGAETVVLTDGAGHIVEGPGFNVFVAKDGALATPDRGALEGVTRKTVIALARGAGFKVSERPVSVEELKAADEVVITSTAGGVMPVTQVDHRPVGSGRPGAVYQALHDAYWKSH